MYKNTQTVSKLMAKVFSKWFANSKTIVRVILNADEKDLDMGNGNVSLIVAFYSAAAAEVNEISDCTFFWLN